MIRTVAGTIAVLTKTRGSHEHLLSQVDGISVGTLPPDLHVVISMGDRDLTRGRLPLATDRWQTVVRPVATDRRGVPVAAARNLAAEIAIGRGAEVLIFLDANVIPGARTLERFAEVVSDPELRQDLSPGPVLWCAPVLTLPEADPALGYPLTQLPELGQPQPTTPQLAQGQLLSDERPLAFYGGSFAISAADFSRTGGFCADYIGRGLQDLDFAQVVLQEEKGSMIWVGGADSYAQPRPATEPDLQVRHALTHVQAWRSRWHTPPEHPWLEGLVAQGLLKRSPDGELSAVN